MAEEKLYMVKNDDGKYWDFNDLGGLWKLSSVSRTATFSKAAAKNIVEHYGGHVVALIEEPEKVVLTEKQAEIVEDAHVSTYPARYITDCTGVYGGDEILLMHAYVNGYTVAKEKKYVVYKNLGGSHNTNAQYSYAQAYKSANHSKTFSWTITSWILNDEDTNGNGSSFQFTESEIEQYGLQDCDKEEVTDDEQ